MSSKTLSRKSSVSKKSSENVAKISSENKNPKLSKKYKKLQIQAAKVVKILKELYPNATIELNFETTFQLMIAVILSAQCTDKRVNMVTPKLFTRFPDAKSFASADLEEIEQLIFSTGFYRAKAKNIKKAAITIMEEFDGKVPDTMKDLLKLGGVARKTANVVLSAGFGKAEGVVVDTHVARLCGLLGLVPKKMAEGKKAVQIERELMKILPESEWGGFSYLMILHGRNICIARRPKCRECALREICPGKKV